MPGPVDTHASKRDGRFRVVFCARALRRERPLPLCLGLFLRVVEGAVIAFSEEGLAAATAVPKDAQEIWAGRQAEPVGRDAFILLFLRQ